MPLWSNKGLPTFSNLKLVSQKSDFTLCWQKSVITIMCLCHYWQKWQVSPCTCPPRSNVVNVMPPIVSSSEAMMERKYNGLWLFTLHSKNKGVLSAQFPQPYLQTTHFHFLRRALIYYSFIKLTVFIFTHLCRQLTWNKYSTQTHLQSQSKLKYQKIKLQTENPTPQDLRQLYFSTGANTENGQCIKKVYVICTYISRGENDTICAIIWSGMI